MNYERTSEIMSARINKGKDKKKILVVEDEPDMTTVITHFLQHAGYEVLIAANGEEGLEKTTSEKPDLILSDTHMPVMSGWEMLEELRKQPGAGHVPVIMVTGCYEKYDIATARRYNITDYIAKPFDPFLLLEKISDIFASNSRRRTVTENI
jgi:CheY-like chemotaxis protein